VVSSSTSNVELYSYGHKPQTPPSEEKQCYDYYTLRPSLCTAFFRYSCVQHACGESRAMTVYWVSKSS